MEVVMFSTVSWKPELVVAIVSEDGLSVSVDE